MPDPLNQGERQIVGGLGGTRVALLKWVRPSFALRWLLVTAFALVLQVHAWGQTDRSEITNQVDTVQAFRQGVLVDTFGKWEIRTGLIDHTYLLVGESAPDGEGHFWLHCDKKNLITVALPLVERPGSDRCARMPVRCGRVLRCRDAVARGDHLRDGARAVCVTCIEIIRSRAFSADDGQRHDQVGKRGVGCGQ